VDHPKLELSFEYLLSKDRLQWITVDSAQVIFLSLCLQSMVEELMRKQQDGGGGSSFPQVIHFWYLFQVK
jgi:sorting nexin-17